MHWKGIYLRRLTKQTEIKADSLKSSLQNASMNFTNMTSHMRETKNGVGFAGTLSLFRETEEKKLSQNVTYLNLITII